MYIEIGPCNDVQVITSLSLRRIRYVKGENMNNSKRRIAQRESHLRGHSRFYEEFFNTKMHSFCMDRVDRKSDFFSFYFDVLQILFFLTLCIRIERQRHSAFT